MRDPVDRAVRAIARRNSLALAWAQFGVAHLVTLAGLALLLLYQPMSSAHFWLLVGVSQALVAIDKVASINPVVAGSVGGGGRVEYTVIGDTVNTAARVEAATRETGDPVLITETTRAMLSTCSIEMVERPGVVLRGKRTPVRLWVPVIGAARLGNDDRAGSRRAPVAD